MILIDATGLIAFLAEEASASKVDALLRSDDAAIVSVNLAETIDVLVRVRGFDRDRVDDVLEPLIAGVLPVVSVGEMEARTAAAVRSDYYHHRESPLSMADCLLLATGVLRRADVATGDAAVASAAVALGLVVRRLL